MCVGFVCMYLPVRNVNVDSILVIKQAPHISHGGVQHPLPFIQAPLLQGAGQGAGVSQGIHLLNLPSTITLLPTLLVLVVAAGGFGIWETL